MCAIPPRALVLTVLQSKWDPENLHRHPDYTTIRKDRLESHPKQTHCTQIKKEPVHRSEEIKSYEPSVTGMVRFHIFTILALMR